MRRVQRLLFIAIATMAILFPATAGAATLHATPANFASMYASAQGGDTILLASGSYGSFNGSAKSGMVTVDEESGASATMSGSTFSSVRNLTLKNIRYTGSICITTPSNTKMNLILDGLDMNSVGDGCGEGRITVRGAGTASIDGNGVQIKNSKFGPGGCSDGIQDSTNGTEIGPGNEFTGITQGSCTQHSDSVQPYASNYVHIHDNWFHGSEQGIMSPDGLSTGYLIENNAMQMDGHNYPCMHLGDTRNGIVRHNTCNTYIRVFGGNQNVNSQNMTIRDNAVPDVSNGGGPGGCTGCTIDHNQTVTFTGTPANTRCAWATASPKGTASDGTDIGLNDCGGTPPPADADGDGVPDSSDNCPGTPPGTQVDSNGCPIGPPPTDHTPVAAFTDTPDPSAPQQTVTFDATGSTCEDTPCTYHWHDIGADGNGNFPLGPDGSTMTFAFQGTGTKYVELVLTDADGDVDSVMHPHEVSNTPPPPDTTPPDTTITNAPSDSQSTSASVSFTSSETGSTFECKLDADAYATCTSPKSYTGLSVGSHTVSVRATDAAGNTDASPATATWTVQSPPPPGGPPTFVAEYESSWLSGSAKTLTVPVNAGDVLVAYAASEDTASPVSVIGGPTWTPLASVTQSGDYAFVSAWGATAATTTTYTVTCSSTGAAFSGCNVLRFSGSSGIGMAASNKWSGTGNGSTPSIGITTTQANSAVVKVVADWAARDGASRNSLTAGVGAFTENTYARDTAGQRYTVYGGRHANVGTAGFKTVGYNAPTAQKWSGLAIEVKGT